MLPSYCRFPGVLWRWSVVLGLTVAKVLSLYAQDGSLDTSFQSPQFGLPIPIIAVEADGKVFYATTPDGIHFTIGRLTATGLPEASIPLGGGPQSIPPPIDFGSIHLPGATNPASIKVLLPLANGQILVG